MRDWFVVTLDAGDLVLIVAAVGFLLWGVGMLVRMWWRQLVAVFKR